MTAEFIGTIHHRHASDIHSPYSIVLDYYDLGVTTFLIRGFDPLDDAIDYGRNLPPLTKRLIAERATTPVAA